MYQKYTGRQIAIFTDVHSLLQPLQAVLEDIDRRGITEIYSLGDNIGVGPNPGEVIDLLNEYGVKSISGNSEDYITLGIEPFYSYFNLPKKVSHEWTLANLSESQIGTINLFPHSIDLLLGGKRLSLCHFANDVRFDFVKNSTWSYQNNIRLGNAYKQFLYTNSLEQKEEIKKFISFNDVTAAYAGGYKSAFNEPLFGGKTVDFYDAIIQGHVHFKLYERGENTEFYTIRAIGMGYTNEDIDTASYVILKEKSNNMGYDVEEVIIKFDREKMEWSILNCNGPTDMIRKFTNMRR